MPATLYSLLTLLSVSNSMGKETGVPCLDSQVVAAFESGSTFTPIIVKPILPYFLWIASRCGISWRQGPHQVAQKLIITTWPLYCASETGLPAREASVKSGAGELVVS